MKIKNENTIMNKKTIIKSLCKIANVLDDNKMTSEADQITKIMVKIAIDPSDFDPSLNPEGSDEDYKLPSSLEAQIQSMEPVKIITISQFENDSSVADFPFDELWNKYQENRDYQTTIDRLGEETRQLREEMKEAQKGFYPNEAVVFYQEASYPETRELHSEEDILDDIRYEFTKGKLSDTFMWSINYKAEKQGRSPEELIDEFMELVRERRKIFQEKGEELKDKELQIKQLLSEQPYPETNKMSFLTISREEWEKEPDKNKFLIKGNKGFIKGPDGYPIKFGFKPDTSG